MTVETASSSGQTVDGGETLHCERQKRGMAHASQWKLMWWKFRSHKLALGSVVILAVLYLCALLAPFLAPESPQDRHSTSVFAPPQKLHFVDEQGFHLRPFVYAYEREIDEETLQWIYTEDTSKKLPIHFFVRGTDYKLFGLIKTNWHLFGVEGDAVFLLGTDNLGRDFLSRVTYAAQISLSLGLVGVAFSFFLGLIIGGLSGFYGGITDTIIQRIIELLRSLPTIPLWMGLSAAIPVSWPTTRTYFMITIILSLLGWTDLARVVRGKILAVREEDYVLAAHLAGASQARIIGRHLIPALFSYTIVSLTLAIPGMILGETALSFLGLGLQAPAVSWGVLIQDAQNVRTLALYPWLLAPVLLVIVTVLCFNFVGDGLRDAADPYVR